MSGFPAFAPAVPAPHVSRRFDPLQPMHGVLPNGEAFAWRLLAPDDVYSIMALQAIVAAAATEHEKKFLIERKPDEIVYAMGPLCQHYWGAHVNDELVGMFGLAENDEEIGNGRGRATPLTRLGIHYHREADVLKAAQIHPAYRDQGLARLGAYVRYEYFAQDPKKQVIMTKVHEDNAPVIANYTKNGFVEADRSTVSDRGETFDVIAFKANRETIEDWLEVNGSETRRRFKLTY